MERDEKVVRDNYELVREEWKKKARDWNYQERYGALGLPGYQAEGKLPITFYGTPYEIDPRTGEVCEAGNPDKHISFSTLMSIYHIFYYSKEKPANTGEWVPFRDVKRAAPFTEAFRRTILKPFAKAFDGKVEKLIEAGNCLGMKRLALSDAGFEAVALPGIPIRFLFWDGDDEFHAQANILFDSSITDYIHEETVVMLADEGIRRLIRAVS